MRNKPEAIYHQLLSDLKAVRSKGLQPLVELEELFGISAAACWQVENWLQGVTFESHHSAIHFYKNIVTSIEGEAECLKKMYHAHLFRPTDAAALKLFYEHELSKMDQFYFEHLDFINYSRSGRCDRDEIYFWDHAKDSINRECVLVLATQKAFERYRLFINLELEKLHG